jgi:hypothetical protein
MADLQKLLFEDKAGISDKEVFAAARLNARMKEFRGRELSDDIIEQVEAAIAEEADRLIADGVLRRRPDWLAAVVKNRLYVAFGSRAVQQLSRELREMGAV